MPRSLNPLARRKSSSSSPFSALPRKKPGPRKTAALEKDSATDRLDDAGSIPSLAPPGVSQDVLSLIHYILSHTWDPVPEVAGMNSERISEILRFRKTLPPIVSLAHLHALSLSPTATERELAGLVGRGVVRKVVIPGRGKGGKGVGEGVIVVEEWKARVREHEGLGAEVKERYIGLMDARPAALTTPTESLQQNEVQQLVRAGFFTNPSAVADAGNLFAALGTSSLFSLSSAGHTAPTGSLAAIGGSGAVHESGGSGSSLATQFQPHRHPTYNKLSQDMTFSLPSTGAYLKLLTSSRLHLLHLLKQLSPRFKEATRDILREKWAGNVLGDSASRAKRARGEWNGVLPGKTKQWREFYGLGFEGVLAEAVGIGVVEVFDTGSVGVGVRGR